MSARTDREGKGIFNRTRRTVQVGWNRAVSNSEFPGDGSSKNTACKAQILFLTPGFTSTLCML